MSLKVLQSDKDAKILVVTPLLSGHSISGETKTTIRRNKTPYIWASYMGPDKHALNVQKGISAYRKKIGGVIPAYIFVLDRDIILGRGTLDKLYSVLTKAEKNVGWCYCPFEYKGFVNVKFPAMEFNIQRLVQQNYISSNSLYRTNMLERVGGFVVDEDTHRLSDWAMWLKCYRQGYIGKLCQDASFIAMSTAGDISAGSTQEYSITRELVMERYIKPLLQMNGS